MEAERARKDLQEYEMLHQAKFSLSTPPIIEPNIVIPPIPVSTPEMLSMTRDEKIMHVYNKIWPGIHAQLTDNLIYRPEVYGKAKASTGKKWDAVYRPERDKLIRRIAKEFFVHCQYVKNLLKASRDNQFSGGMGSNEENGKGSIPEQQSGTSVGESEQGGQQHAQTPSSHRPQGRDRKGKGKKKVSMIDVAEQGSDPGGKIREMQEQAALSSQIQQPEQEYDHMRSFFSPATTKSEFYGTTQQQDSSHMGSFLSLASARGTGLYGDPLNPYQPLYSPQLDYSQNEAFRREYDDLHPGQWPRSD